MTGQFNSKIGYIFKNKTGFRKCVYTEIRIQTRELLLVKHARNIET